jgi:hypothetical protein
MRGKRPSTRHQAKLNKKTNLNYYIFPLAYLSGGFIIAFLMYKSGFAAGTTIAKHTRWSTRNHLINRQFEGRLGHPHSIVLIKGFSFLAKSPFFMPACKTEREVKRLENFNGPIGAI